MLKQLVGALFLLTYLLLIIKHLHLLLLKRSRSWSYTFGLDVRLRISVSVTEAGLGGDDVSLYCVDGSKNACCLLRC